METEGNWLGNSFEDFLHLIPREHRLVQLYNFSPTLNVEEAVEAVKQINQIVFTENFQYGVSSINKKTGLSLKSLHIRQNEYTEKISPLVEEQARELLNEEYKFLEKTRAIISA